MKATEIRREIADLMRSNTALVDQYLEHARGYANLLANHAEAVVKEVFNFQHLDPDTVLLAALKLAEERDPGHLEGKIRAVAKKARVSQVFVCRRTMTVYLFGSIYENSGTRGA